MLFNVRLVFVRTNTFDAQLFKDPMNRWVVKIEEQPTAFDPSPWVNYQGEMYMGQEGVRYQLVIELDRVDKWVQVVTTQKPKEPPYEKTLELKFLNSLKVIHNPVDDPNIAIYKREKEQTKQCYFARNPPPHFVVKDKVLYVYLRISLTMIVTPMCLDNYVVLYKPMEERVVQDLTWHGLPIPKLAPKPTSSQSKKDLNGKGVMDGVVPNTSKAASSRAGIRSVGRPPIPNAPTTPPQDPFSTLCRQLKGLRHMRCHYPSPPLPYPQ